jgi:hypothetical protein
MTQSNTTGSASTNTETVRFKYRIAVVALGLGAIIAATAIILWSNPNGASTTLGIVTSPIAAITGAYFGVQVSSSAAKDAQDRADKAERDKAQSLTDRATALGALDPETVKGLTLTYQP